jgi:predicted RNA methylase
MPLGVGLPHLSKYPGPRKVKLICKNGAEKAVLSRQNAPIQGKSWVCFAISHFQKHGATALISPPFGPRPTRQTETAFILKSKLKHPNLAH